MKKVVCVIDSLGSGGAQRQIIGLAQLLCQNDIDTQLVWYDNDSFYYSELIHHGIPHEKIVSKGNKLSKLVSCAKFIKKTSPNTVISYIDGPNIIFSLLKFFGFKYKLIVSERNTTQTILIRDKIKFLLYRWADVIVTNSYSQRDFINNEYHKLSSKVKVITNFVDTDFFVPSIAPPQKNNVTNILVVARIVEQKNVITFINAINKVIKSIPNIRVDWYGAPYGGVYFEKCQKEITLNGLSDLFVIHKECNSILRKYQECDVFCLPSLYEGFPNVICEAMSCGKPILASNVCDNQNLVHDGDNGYLFDPKDINNISETIIKYCDLLEEIKEKMGVCSRNRALEICSKESFIDKYLKLI